MYVCMLMHTYVAYIHACIMCISYAYLNAIHRQMCMGIYVCMYVYNTHITLLQIYGGMHVYAISMFRYVYCRHMSLHVHACMNI